VAQLQHRYSLYREWPLVMSAAKEHWPAHPRTRAFKLHMYNQLYMALVDHVLGIVAGGVMVLRLASIMQILFELQVRRREASPCVAWLSSISDRSDCMGRNR